MREFISRFLKPTSSVMLKSDVRTWCRGRTESRQRALTLDFDIIDDVGFKNLEMWCHHQRRMKKKTILISELVNEIWNMFVLIPC